MYDEQIIQHQNVPHVAERLKLRVLSRGPKYGSQYLVGCDRRVGIKVISLICLSDLLKR